MDISFYLFSLYCIVGLFTAIDYIVNAEDGCDDIEVPALLICAVVVMFFWPVRAFMKLQDYVMKKLIK